MTLVRAVQPAEFAATGRLLVDAYDSVPGATVDPDYNRELADVAARAQLATVLVAVEGSEISGSITFAEGGQPLAELSCPGEAEIRMFAVARWARGRGVGTLLVQSCLGRARTAGCERVWLSTSPWMVDAQRLYERLGFRRMAARDRVERSSSADFELLAYVLEVGN